MDHEHPYVCKLVEPLEEKFDVVYNPNYFPPVALSPPVRHIDAHSGCSFILIGKLKSTVNEVLFSLSSAGNAYDVDEFVSVTEDFLKELKIIKLGRRIESRRANTHKNPSASSPMLQETQEDLHGEESSPFTTPVRSRSVPKNRASSTLPQKKHSRRASAFVTDELTRDTIEAARHVSALRNEERQRQAEERRLDHLYEIKKRLVKAEARGQRAKARREEAVHKQRAETMDRQESAVRRVREARKQTVERVQRAHSRGEEVRLTNELRHQTMVLLLDKKMSDVGHNQEIKREAQERRAQERREAMSAAAQRRRNLSEEKAERQQQRELQRQETLRRLEEQKKLELELKQQKAEEWEKKVHQRHEEAHAEMEALTRKAEGKFQQSQQVLEEQREKRRQKLEREDQKQREAKSRRDREGDGKMSLQEAMPFLTIQKEEEMASRIAKLVSSSSRQGKAFSDNYQKESLFSTKDLNRSKLRVAFSRLSTFTNAASVGQCKQVLHDLVASGLGTVDHEFIRYFNSFEVIVGLFGDARRARDVAMAQEAIKFIKYLLVAEGEGKQNVVYFLKSGSMVSVLLELWEEVAFLQQHNNAGANTVNIHSILEVVALCLERVCLDSQFKLAPVRDQMLYELDVMGVDQICFSILKAPPLEAQLNLVYCALYIINTQLCVFSRYRNEARYFWFQHATASLFSLLQNTLLADKSASQSERSLKSAQITVLFVVFRTLNMLARWQLSVFQDLLSETIAPGGAVLNGNTPCAATTQSNTMTVTTAKDINVSAFSLSWPLQITRMELFHILNGFFAYIREHVEDLETIPSSTLSCAAGTGRTSSYEDAMRFGITVTSLPALLGFIATCGSSKDPIHEESNSPAKAPYPLREALHECILLVGYLCLDNGALQETMCWGKSKTLIATMLNVLPIHYFSTARHILFPTILCAIDERDQVLKHIQDEMEVKLLHSFLSEEFANLSKKAKSYAQTRSRQLKAYRSKSDAEQSATNPVTHAKDTSHCVRGVDEGVEEADDDVSIHTLRSNSVEEATVVVEKAKLCKALRTSGSSSTSDPSFYRIERRLPISYWPGIITQLEHFLASEPDNSAENSPS